MIVTFGLLAIFLAVVIGVLQIYQARDKSFSDYAVAGRSFGARFQAMSFLNTWYPGAMFTAFCGMAAGSGAVAFYVLSYSLLTVVLMYAMAKTVWIWGKKFDLRTQPDLLALRYGSRHIRPLAGLIGIASAVPWLVLGFEALGQLFYSMSLQKIPFSAAVGIGIAVIVLRQFWTVRMGMRGVVISDMVQGIVAYGLGTAMLIGLICWLVLDKHVSFASIPASMLQIPGYHTKEGPLYFFSLLFTGTVGGWCLPFVFVRLFTANGVDSLKRSAAISMPISLIFCGALLVFGMLASVLPDVAKSPSQVWFLVSYDAGGVFLLGLAGMVLLAATMGNADGSIQATGAQIANDLIGNYVKLEHKQLIIVSKIGMAGLTVLSAWLATLHLPALFSIAVLGYQGVIQLAVPQFIGLFWKRGNKYGAISGMLIGFALAMYLELTYPGYVPWAWGLSSGTLALAVNLVIYVACAYLIPQSTEEKNRISAMFDMVRSEKQTGNSMAGGVAPQAAE